MKYVSRLAWLNTEMDGDSKGRRADLLPEDNPLKTLPDINKAPYLLTYCMDLGLFKYGAMGITPVDWPDIASWSSLTETFILPQEARIIRDVSFAYVSQCSKAKAPECPAPYLQEVTKQQRGAMLQNRHKKIKRVNN